MGYIFAVALAIIGGFAFSGPAGADHEPAHVTGPEPYFTCSASTARVILGDADPIPPVDPLAANLEREECAEDTGGLPDIALPPPPAAPTVATTTAQARTQILCADDDPDPLVDPEDNEECDAGVPSYEQQVLSTANVTNTTITLGSGATSLKIIVQAANTSARARCGPGNVPVLSGTSRVLGVAIGVGENVTPVPAVITDDPNQVIEIPGLVKITLNELITAAGADAGPVPNAEGEAAYPDAATEGRLTSRAVHVEFPGGTEPGLGSVADVVIAESVADFHGDVCPEGKIVVNKETAPEESPNATDFGFTSPGLTPATFTLQDDGTRSFDDVQPGGYMIAENAPAAATGYQLTAINCAENRDDTTTTDDNTTTSLPTRTAAIKVGPGETVTCTFINAKPAGVCPDGSAPNQQGQCLVDPTCPAGSTLNPTTKQCIINTTNCPANSTPVDPNNPNAGCVVTNITCPADSTGPNAQGQCIKNTITCPPPSQQQGGNCVNNTITCPAGTTGPNGQGQCVSNTLQCPAGSQQVGNQCVVSRPDCPQGSARNPQGQCVISNVQCPAGTAFNPTTLGCTSAPRGGTLVPIGQVRYAFPASPCVGQGFGQLVGIVGTNGADRITGTNFSDRIFALAGSDRVSGGRGDDCVEGGAGNDVIDGSNGNDVMIGATGNDSIVGGPGRDRMEGGSGRDVLSGASGNDRMLGGGGKDRLAGGYGNDRLIGGSGNDGIHTGNGRDRVLAGSGNDIINAATRGAPARVDCGPGKDRVRINKNERRSTRNCEFIDITTRIKGRGTPRR